MQIEPTFSTTAAESLKRALGIGLTPALQAELVKVGVDYGKPLRAAYRQEVWDGALGCAAAALFPALAPRDAYFELGRRYIKGFSETLLGKAVVELGRLVGPERTLKRMQHNQRSTNNYSVVQMEKVGPAHFRLKVGVVPEALPAMVKVPGVDSPAFLGGIYLGVLELLALKSPRVTFHEVDAALQRVDYELTWG